MEIMSKKEEMMIPMGAIVIIVPVQEAKAMLEVLNTLKKKSKLDRYEEYILHKLINALEHPEEDRKWVEKDKKEVPKAEVKKVVPVKVKEGIDKVKIIDIVKQRVDARNEKSMEVFIVESIDFAQKNLSIKTKPKDTSVEAFYDWLLVEQVISEDGSPRAR